jgi:pyruvate formate lyase activating enzyme
MKFYGLQKTTLIDYPGEVASTIFTFGCNLRCPYCHNPELVDKSKRPKPIDWSEIFKFLNKRKKLIAGVCISGGEPLIHDELYKIVEQIHSLGLKVKIDTNGTNPENLKKIECDFISMDIKTSLEKYKLLGYTEKKDLNNLILESIDFIINSNIDHEFRTTSVPSLVEINDIKEIVKLIKNSKKYVIAQFRSGEILDPKWLDIKPYPQKILEEMKSIADQAGLKCELRSSY